MEYWDREAKALQHDGDHPLDFDGLYAVADNTEHLKLCDAPGPAVILTGSGMCNVGRIIGHLKYGIENAANDILLFGYRAVGTPGRTIQKYGHRKGAYIDLDGQRRMIKPVVVKLVHGGNR